MRATHKRYTIQFVILLIVAIVFGMVGCKKAQSDTVPYSSSSLVSITDTVTEETTSVITSETTSETSLPTDPSEVTDGTTPQETAESEPSETTPVSTVTPINTPTFTETTTITTEPTEVSTETSSTPPTDTPVATSTPEPVVETETPMPTTEPETETTTPATTMFPPPENSKSTAISAMKAAVQDVCSEHYVSYTDENGQIITIPFQFNDAVMSNVQKRADHMAETNVLGHYEIDGTWTLLEAVAGMGSDLTDEGGTLHWHYFWTDYAGQNHYYDSYYDCIYAVTVFLITEHTTQLSTSESKVCYGVGFASRKESTPSYQGIDLFLVNYGVQVEYEYSYVIVVQGASDFDIAVYGFDYDYTVE